MLLRSPFGHTLLAIRENERRARFLGIPVELHIWIVVHHLLLLHLRCRRAVRAAQQLRRPEQLYYVMSGNIVIMAVLGGIRTLLGPAARRRRVRRAAGLLSSR